MKNILAIIFTLLLFVPLNAQNTWLGGDGYWHNANRWSYGTVPTANEGVEINNGTVKILSPTSAYANRVEVSTGASLIVTAGAKLTVDASTTNDVHGMMITGDLEVRGKLAVSNVGYGDGINLSGNGVFLIKKSGAVNIRNTDSNGIWSNATVINRGYLYVTDTGNHGIFNLGLIDNDQGNITMIDVGASGISCWSTAQLLNSGKISIKGTGAWGIYLRDGSYAHNDDGAEIIIAYTASSGIVTVSNNNTFENSGSIYIAHIDVYGIYNYDTFINHEEGSITIEDALYGLVNQQDANFDNTGALFIGDEMTFGSLYNKGDFINHACSEISTDNKVRNYTPGVINNEGNWYNNSTLTSINTGQFINDGLIEDSPNTFPVSIINNEMIAKPINGTIQVGTPVSNALEVGNITNHTVNGWYTTEGLIQTAGPYNAVLNEWTPHANTVGLTEVFVSLSHDDDNCNSIISVPITNGVVPFIMPDILGDSNKPQPISQFETYPNPFDQSMNIRIPLDVRGAYLISISTVSGHVVYKEQAFLQAGTPWTIDIDNHLSSGAYIISISNEQSIIWTDKLLKLP